jgi:hypothetical protein
MKTVRPIALMLLIIFVGHSTYSQNKKFDKSLRKIDKYYAE